MASASELGWRAGLEKAAAAARALDGVRDQVLADAREIAADATLTSEHELEDALPEDGALELLVANQEQNFGVKLDDAVIARLFAHGTLGDLAREISRLATQKVASSDPQARQRAHQRYLVKRPQMLAASKAYRMAHMQMIRRKSRAYRRKVKRGIHRPKKRVGTAASGFMFIPR